MLTVGTATYPLAEIERILVVGAGKAGAPMSAALCDILGDRISAGVVNVKYGHTAPMANPGVMLGSLAALSPTPAQAPTPTATLTPTPRKPHRGRLSHRERGVVELIEAGHPIPDAAGIAGAERIAGLLETAGERDLVIVLLSGGGSALLPLPAAGVTLDDYQVLNGLLLRSGADITEINTVRKHCSRLQGGQMARLAAPAWQATLILSDVVGSPLDVIASGPTVADPTTYADALAILERFGVTDQTPPTLLAHLRRGAAGPSPTRRSRAIRSSSV